MDWVDGSEHLIIESDSVVPGQGPDTSIAEPLNVEGESAENSQVKLSAIVNGGEEVEPIATSAAIEPVKASGLSNFSTFQLPLRPAVPGAVDAGLMISRRNLLHLEWKTLTQSLFLRVGFRLCLPLTVSRFITTVRRRK